jgi:hypothetical protein
LWRHLRVVEHGRELGMSVDIDSLGLATQGAGLAAEQAPLAPVPVTPPGNDPVSMYAVAVLSTQWLRLSLVTAHGSVQKVVGGLAVTATGAGFEAQDKLNIGLFDQLGKLGELAQMASGASSPNLPDLLALPTAPPPPAIPPQVFSELLFAGPGGSVVRDQAQLLRGQIGLHRQDADQALSAGTGIDGAWQDGGNQQAGANTTQWGDWKHDTVGDMETLAKGLDAFADANDRARQATPTPDEYQQAFDQLSQAMASGNPVAAAQAATRISELNAKSGEAMTAYYGDVTALVTALNGDLKTAPAIAGGHGDGGGDQQQRSGQSSSSQGSGQQHSGGGQGQGSSGQQGGGGGTPSGGGPQPGGTSESPIANPGQAQPPGQRPVSGYPQPLNDFINNQLPPGQHVDPNAPLSIDTPKGVNPLLDQARSQLGLQPGQMPPPLPPSAPPTQFLSRGSDSFVPSPPESNFHWDELTGKMSKGAVMTGGPMAVAGAIGGPIDVPATAIAAAGGALYEGWNYLDDTVFNEP